MAKDTGYRVARLNHSGHSDEEQSLSTTIKTSYILPKTVQFGYHEIFHSRQMSLSRDYLTATKDDPASQYAHGVCYGASPLKGTVEFEVEILSYGTGWSGTMKLGVMRCKVNTNVAQLIPRYSPEASNHCVWSSTKIHNRLEGSPSSVEAEKHYSNVNLDDLRVGSKVGLRLSNDGVLTFFVDGRSQGVAAENVYLQGYDVYVVVDHYANCKATRITRAIMRIELNLEELCIELIASLLKSEKDADALPLPPRLIKRLAQSIRK